MGLQYAMLTKRTGNSPAKGGEPPSFKSALQKVTMGGQGRKLTAPVSMLMSSLKQENKPAMLAIARKQINMPESAVVEEEDRELKEEDISCSVKKMEEGPLSWEV